MKKKFDEKNFFNARRGKQDTVLTEGIHAFKHALQFNAKFLKIIYSDINQIENMQQNILKKEAKNFLFKNGQLVEEEYFNKLLPYQIRSKILAIAEKPKYILDSVNSKKPIIFLENPSNPENLGMAIRTAAAYGCSAVITTGRISPFCASVIRSSAGLSFAIPVFKIKNFKDIIGFQDRSIIVADPEGESIKKNIIPKKSIIVFGTERKGVSEKIKKISDKKIKLDMKSNISSLNLATSISAFLFSAKFK